MITVSLSCNNEAHTRKETRETIVPPKKEEPLQAPEIRVAVIKDATELRLRARSSALRVSGPNGQELARIPGDNEIHLSLGTSGLILNGQVLSVPAIHLESISAHSLEVNGQELSRHLAIYRDPARNGLLTTVAQMNLEEYLIGVLAGEVPYERWGREALKAQAITSRSYALYQMKIHAQDAYDVESTVMSQVFKSGFKDHPILKDVVDRTRGLALTEKGRLFPAYFHSTCGGHTVPVQGVFVEQPPLSTLGGTRCPFCVQSPSYRWQALIKKEVLRDRLRASPECQNQRLGEIQSIEFICGEGKARAETVRIRHALGETVLRANRFRLIVGPGELRSVMVESTLDRGDSFEFQGRGFGHGVGLCQYGSQGMAEKGYSCEQILGFYYPGGDLTKWYGDRLIAGR